MTAPPLMSRTTPVIQLASSEARYTAARATSCGVPSRRSGWDWISSCCCCSGIQALFFSDAYLSCLVSSPSMRRRSGYGQENSS